MEKKNIKYVLCEAPLCVGAPTSGSEYAFSHLMKNGMAQKLGEKFAFSYFGETLGFSSRDEEREDHGRFALIKVEKTIPSSYEESLKEAKTVMYINRVHYRKVKSVLKHGVVPVTVGGDHSIAMSSIAALSEMVGKENLAVIYIDGHTDINTDVSSESGYIHGMPLAAAMGLCCDTLTVGENKVNLYGENTYIIGARSIDEGEWPIIKEQGVHLYTADRVREQGFEKVIERVLSDIEKKGNMKIHLSFDVDSIDGEEFPATGYVMPSGLSYEAVFKMLKTVLEDEKLASFDFVEYNPSLDKNGECLEKVFDILALLH